MFELLHLLPEDCSSHIPVNSILSAVTGLLSLVMSQWYSLLPVSPLKGHRVAMVCLEHEIPLLEAEKDSKCSFFCYLKRFSGMCVYWVYKAPFHYIFLLLCSFNRIIIVPSFIKCDRLVSVSFLEPCALRSWHTVHWSTKQIEQMFLTLCTMPHPQILSVGYTVRG